MSKLERLAEARKEYLNVLSEIEDTGSETVKSKASILIKDLMIHEQIALESFEDQQV